MQFKYLFVFSLLFLLGASNSSCGGNDNDEKIEFPEMVERDIHAISLHSSSNWNIKAKGVTLDEDSIIKVSNIYCGHKYSSLFMTDEWIKDQCIMPEWIHLYSKPNSDLFYATVDSNPSYDSREGDIVIHQLDIYTQKTDENHKVVVHVIQRGKTEIILDKKEIDLPDERGGDVTLPIKSNTDYTIRCDGDWFSCKKNSDETLTISIQPITILSEKNRKGIVYIENEEESLLEEIAVNQYYDFGFTESSLDLLTGQETSIKCKRIGYSEEKDVIWSSSNDEIATVDYTGKIKAVSKGTCTIKVSNELGYESFCTINVKDITDYINVSYGSAMTSFGNFTTIDISNNSPVDIMIDKVELYFSNSIVGTDNNSELLRKGNTKTITFDGLYNGLYAVVYFTYDGVSFKKD